MHSMFYAITARKLHVTDRHHQVGPKHTNCASLAITLLVSVGLVVVLRVCLDSW